MLYLKQPGGFWIAALLTIYVFMGPRPGGCGTLEITPSIDFRQEVTDNLLYEADNPVDDAVSTVAPELALLNRSGNLTAAMSSRLIFIRHFEHSEFDSTDRSFSGRLGYQWSPRWGLSVSANHSRDSRSDRDFEETGLVQTTDIRRQTRLSLSTEYFLTPTKGMNFSYSYYQENGDDPTLNDVDGHTFSLAYFRDLRALWPRLTGSANLRYAFYDYKRSFDQSVPFSFFGIPAGSVLTSTSDLQKDDYLNLYWGLRYLWSKKVRLNIELGAGYHQTELRRSVYRTYSQGVFPDEALPDRIQDSRSWNFVGLLEAVYADKINEIRFSISEDLGSPTGTTGSTRRTSFHFAIGRKLSLNGYARLSASLIQNTADRESILQSDANDLAFTVTPLLRYRIIDNLVLEISYKYSLTRYRITDTHANRNLVSIRIAYQLPSWKR